MAEYTINAAFDLEGVKAFVYFEIDLADAVRFSAEHLLFGYNSILGVEDASDFFEYVGSRRFFEAAHERDV